MSALKDVTGALAPYAALAGIALVAYRYRDQILAWITGGLSGAGEAVRDVVETATGLPTNDPAQSDQYCRSVFGAGWIWDPWLKACRSGWTGQTSPDVIPEPIITSGPAGFGSMGGEDVLITLINPATLEPMGGTIPLVAPAPVEYTPPARYTYEDYRQYDVVPSPGYDIIRGNLGLNLRDYAWNLDLVDPSGKFIANVAASGGTDPAVWSSPTLRSFLGLI